MEEDDVEFVRELFHASYRRLVGQLTAVTGNHAEAEDVVQEAFVRAVDRARSVRRTDNPEAWLRTVAVNVARSRFRRNRRLVPLPESEGEGTTDLGMSRCDRHVRGQRRRREDVDRPDEGPASVRCSGHDRRDRRRHALCRRICAWQVCRTVPEHRHHLDALRGGAPQSG